MGHKNVFAIVRTLRTNGKKVIGLLVGLAHEKDYCVSIVTQDPSIAQRSDNVCHMADEI